MSSEAEEGSPAQTKWRTVEQAEAEAAQPIIETTAEPIRKRGHCRLKVTIEWVDEETGEVIADCDEDRRISHLFKDNHLSNAETRILDVWKDIKVPMHTELMDYVEKLKPAKEVQIEDDTLMLPSVSPIALDIPGT